MRPLGYGLIVAASIATPILSAQTPALPAAAPDAGEAVVIEALIVHHSFDVDGTRTSEAETRVRVLSAAGVQAVGTLGFPYQRDLTTLDIVYARVRKPGGEVVETPPSSVIETPADITRAAPTFTDVYVKNLNLRGLSVGDTVEYRVRERARSMIPGHFWMDQGLWPLVVADLELRVSVPASVNPIVRSRTVQPETSEADGRRMYVWRHRNPKRLSDADLEIALYKSRDLRPEIQVTSFRTWAEVGAAVRELWKDRLAITPAVRERALELTRGLTSEADKIRALYTFVSTKIRYVSVSLGVGFIQPHRADEVLAAGFGDCKDKHVLLAAMLDAVGVKADAALIGVDVPFDRDVPSPAPFNHVITRTSAAGASIWLDTTLEVAPVGFLPVGERDRNVLVVPASGEAEVLKTPATASRPNELRTRLEGSLDASGKLTASMTDTTSGDIELVLRALFRSVSQARWTEVVKGFSVTERFGGTVSDVTASSPEDTAAPFTITYRYTNDALSAWKTQQFVPVMPLLGVMRIDETSPPVVPVSIVESRTIATVRVEIPEGFEATLGAGSQAQTIVEKPFGTYRYSTSIKGRIYEAERELTVKKLEVPVAQFDEYRAWTKAIDDVREYMNLRESKPWAFGDTMTIDWYAGTSPAMATTIRSATDASNNGDHKQALALLDDLTRAEPGNAALWVLLSWTQEKAGDIAGGLETLRRQVDKTPSPSLSKLLAWRLTASLNHDEAVRVLVDARKRFPEDREVPLYLGEALIAAGRPAEAAEIFAPMTLAQPASARLHWNLGKVLVRTKQPDVAVTAFKRAAELDASPRGLNEVAWELAIHGVALDDAIALSTRSVDGIEADVAKVSLASLTDANVAMMPSLADYWDTLAWAYFRKGDLDKAERYQYPAFDLSYGVAHAEHLGEMTEARKDLDAAIRYYAYGSAGTTPDATAAASFERLVPAAADREKARAAALDAIRLGRLVDVPRLPNAEGTAEAFVLVGDGGAVEDVKFVTGSAALRPQAEMLRTVKVPSRVPHATAKVIRRGVLTCAAAATNCQFRLLAAGTVTSAK